MVKSLGVHQHEVNRKRNFRFGAMVAVMGVVRGGITRISRTGTDKGGRRKGDQSEKSGKGQTVVGTGLAFFLALEAVHR